MEVIGLPGKSGTGKLCILAFEMTCITAPGVELFIHLEILQDALQYILAVRRIINGKACPIAVVGQMLDFPAQELVAETVERIGARHLWQGDQQAYPRVPANFLGRFLFVKVMGGKDAVRRPLPKDRQSVKSSGPLYSCRLRHPPKLK